MSALQLENFLGERHRAEYGTNGQNKYVHLFVYDRYYSWTKFQKEFPNATMGGVGWLNGWEWHIQSSGNSNIRPVYGFDTRADGSTPTEQSQQGTFGYIFQVTPEDLETVRTLYRGKRIKLTTTIDAALKYWSKDRQFEVVAFFDPYDTDTITRRTVGDRFAEGTLLEWLRGGQELQLLGCPSWYMKKFFDSISRRVAISHSLRGIYVKPETRKANMQNAGNPIDELRIRLSEQQTNHQQRLQVRAPGSSLASNSGVLKVSTMKVAQGPFTPEQQQYMLDTAQLTPEEIKQRAMSQLTPAQRDLMARVAGAQL